MKRIDRIRNMPIEEIAKSIRNIASLELDDYCKSTCEFAGTLEDEPLEEECVKCCIEWLNEEVEEIPAVYDVDKVLEQLRECERYVYDAVSDEDSYVIDTEKAIEIVKGAVKE